MPRGDTRLSGGGRLARARTPRNSGSCGSAAGRSGRSGSPPTGPAAAGSRCAPPGCPARRSTAPGPAGRRSGLVSCRSCSSASILENTMASGLLISSFGLAPLRGQDEIGDVLQHVGGLVVGGAGRRQPGARGGQLPRPAHLQRVQQQHDAVGRGEVPDVLLDGLLRAQVLARRCRRTRAACAAARPARPALPPAVQADGRGLGGEPEHQRRPVARPRPSWSGPAAATRGRAASRSRWRTGGGCCRRRR